MSQLGRTGLNSFIMFYKLSKSQTLKVKKEGLKMARCTWEEKACATIKKQYMEKRKVDSSKDNL